jgi:hypothetical protein
MVRNLVIRRATTADREAVLGIATAGMHEFGLVPDFAGLDVELGLLGEDREGAIVELVAVVGNAICGSVIISSKGGRVGKLSGFYVSGGGSCQMQQDGAGIPRDVGPNDRSRAVVRIDRLGTRRRPSDQQRCRSIILAAAGHAQQGAPAVRWLALLALRPLIASVRCTTYGTHDGAGDAEPNTRSSGGPGLAGGARGAE